MAKADFKVVVGYLSIMEGFDPIVEIAPQRDGRELTDEEMIRLSERLAVLAPEKGFELVGGPLTPERMEEMASGGGEHGVFIQVLAASEKDAEHVGKRIGDLLFFGDY
jgi:hypothetical protein